MKRSKSLLFCFCILASLASAGQKKGKQVQADSIGPLGKIPPRQHDFVKLSGEIKLIDSQYILILTLSVSGKNEITVDKRRYFDVREYSIAPNRLALSKIIRRDIAHIYTRGIKHPMYSPDWDKKIKVTTQNSLTDTLNVATFYPLEIGEYFIIAEIDYWYKSAKYTAESDEIPFSVLYLPKYPPFN